MQPVAFFSRKLKGAEINWSTHEEALAQVTTTWQLQPDWKKEIVDTLAVDVEAREAFRAIRNNEPGWVEENELLFFHEKLYVPNLPHVRLALLQEAHEVPSAAHPGVGRTTTALTDTYYWKELKVDVKNFVATCDVCQRVKAPRMCPGCSSGPKDQVELVHSISSSNRRSDGALESDRGGYAQVLSIVPERGGVPAATDYLRARVEALRLARQHAQEANNRQAQQANKHHRL